MRGKKITRQLSKFLETDDFDQDLGELTALLAEKQISLPKETLLSGLGDFLDAVEKAYEQSEKMLSIANHSLYLSSEELNQKNKNLHQTQALIRDMLNSLPEGFMIFDRQGNCTSLVSRKALDLMEKNPEGMSLPASLGIHDSAEAESLLDWYNFLFEEKMPFEDLADLGPKRLNHSDPGRHIHLHFKPIRNEESRLHSVVMIAIDMTAEIQAIAEAELMRSRSEMILHRHQNPQGFFRCLELVEEGVQRARNLRASASLSPIEIEELQRDLHTLKGTLGMFSINGLRHLAHELEDKIKEAEMQGEVPGDLAAKVAQELEAAYQNFHQEHQKILSLDKRKADQRQISGQGIQQFLAWVSQRPDAAEIAAQFRQDILFIPLSGMIETLMDGAQQTAKRVEKNLICHLDCPSDLRVDPQLLEGFEVLVHLVSNAVDHGIESPDEREASGKAATGNLIFEARRSNQYLVLKFQDDGRGINLSRVRQKSTELGLITADASEPEVLQSIFSHGFSTKDEVSETSGRGVGLDAVKNWVEKLQGEIKVVSQSGIGTSFEVHLPIFQSTEARQRSVA